MNIQEFTDRTGFTPTDDYYYNVIEKAYMQSDLDKDAFCKQWKRKGGIQEAYDALRLEAANNYSKALTLETSYQDLEEETTALRNEAFAQSETIRLLQDELDKRDEKKADIDGHFYDTWDSGNKSLYGYYELIK
jgi:hypothetical protein